MNKNILYIVISIVLVVAFFFLLSFFQRDAENGVVSPTPIITPIPTPENDEPEVIGENWTEYRDDTIGFAIRYPEIMDIDEPAIGGVSFTYLGPTQTEATEIFDGIRMTVGREDMSDNFEDVEEFARNKMESEQVHADRVVEDFRSTVINGMEAYTFTLEGLGVITHIVLEHSVSGILYVTYIAPDPEERGYRQVVDHMLLSLEII